MKDIAMIIVYYNKEYKLKRNIQPGQNIVELVVTADRGVYNGRGQALVTGNAMQNTFKMGNSSIYF